MKRTLSWMLLLGLLLCSLIGCSRGTQDRLPRLPEDKTVTLTICGEEQQTQKHLFTKKEIQALNRALAKVTVQPVKDWTVPENPWPIYGLFVTDLKGDGRDLDVACFGDLWIDNQGRAFRVKGLDMQSLTDLFPDGWEQIAGSFLPSRWALALCGGSWNRRFMIPSAPVFAPDDLSMTLDSSSDELSWTLSNLSSYEFSHGNGGWAKLQVCLEDGWYDLPSQYSCYTTAEGHILSPGESYSSTFPLELYGSLPAGNYRIAFPLYREGETQPLQVYSAVYFLVLEDGTFAQENL